MGLNRARSFFTLIFLTLALVACGGGGGAGAGAGAGAAGAATIAPPDPLSACAPKVRPRVTLLLNQGQPKTTDSTTTQFVSGFEH